MRVNSYRLSTVPDAFLRIKLLDSLVIHLMRHSSIVIIVRFYIGTTSIPLPRSSTELSGRPSDCCPSDDENRRQFRDMVSSQCLQMWLSALFFPRLRQAMVSSWRFSVAPPVEKRKKASEQDCSEARFSGGSRLFAARRRRPYPNRF